MMQQSKFEQIHLRDTHLPVPAHSNGGIASLQRPRLDALAQQAFLQHALGADDPRPLRTAHELSVLLLEGVHESAARLFAGAGFAQVTRLPNAFDEKDLMHAVRGVHLLGIRSRTRLTEPVLAAARELVAVGCFSVGTSQVDVAAARRHGVAVFNAPFSNTRSVAELVIGQIIMLFRRTFAHSVDMHGGKWRKSATGSYEVRGKTLGIVGYGSIGSQLSNLAEAIGMRVIYFDAARKLRHGNAGAAASLAELMRSSDVISLHVPEAPSTKQMIGACELALMRKGSYLINCSRGSVVDLEAVAAALRSGDLAGAAVDVFPTEPSDNSKSFTCPLVGLENVILTPHVAGSTEEAQGQIGTEVAHKLIQYADIGTTAGSVNFPQLLAPALTVDTRFIGVHRHGGESMDELHKPFARRGIKVTASYSATDGEICCVVLDAACSLRQAAGILDDIRRCDGTMRVRAVPAAAP
jgi:D-3-phosphoglycerate dehydrogenase